MSIKNIPWINGLVWGNALFLFMWMAGCMRLTCLEKRWHQNALWKAINMLEADWLLSTVYPDAIFWRLCDFLLGNLGFWNSFKYSIDIHPLPKHFCRPRHCKTPFFDNAIPKAVIFFNRIMYTETHCSLMVWQEHDSQFKMSQLRCPKFQNLNLIKYL